MKQKYRKDCPFCGQGLIPFKLGVCFCGKQATNIHYVTNTQRFAKTYYYLENTIPEKYDTVVDETFAGIEEFAFIV